MTEQTCFNCQWWQRALGLKFDSWTSRSYPKLDGFEAVGAGHCEHPERPRGLTLSPYNCGRDWQNKQPMVDVTPKPTLLAEDRP